MARKDAPKKDAATETAKAETPSAKKDASVLSAQIDKHNPIPEDRKTEMAAFQDDHPAPPKKQQWTIAVNLATTMKVDPDTKKEIAGPEHQMADLEKLAAQTKDKPVTMVVQQLIKNPNAVDKPNKTDEEKNKDYLVQRYVIKDGEVKKDGPPQESQGLAKDLGNLVRAAEKDHPAEHLALIESAHGGGSRGLAGDQEVPVSMKDVADELKKAVNEPIKNDDGTVREPRGKFDVVDFDSCLMGQNEVVDAMTGVTDHLVASEETQKAVENTAAGTLNCQDIAKAIQPLVDNPNTSPKDFADSMVETARKNRSDKIDAETHQPYTEEEKKNLREMNSLEMSGVDTLAHYDMSKAPELHDAIDKLGKTLTSVAQDPASRAELEKAIEKTSRLNGAAPDDVTSLFQQRDLKQFLDNVRARIGPDGIKDDANQTLKKTLDEVEAKLDKFVVDKQGTTQQMKDRYAKDPVGPRYDELGSLGIHLPDDAFRDPKTTAQQRNSLTEMNQVMDMYMRNPNAPEDARRTALNKLLPLVQSVKNKLPDAERAKLEALEKDLSPKDENVNTLATWQQLKKEAQSLMQGPAYQHLIQKTAEENQKEATKASRLVKESSTNDGWKLFTETMAKTAPKR